MSEVEVVNKPRANRMFFLSIPPNVFIPAAAGAADFCSSRCACWLAATAQAGAHAGLLLLLKQMCMLACCYCSSRCACWLAATAQAGVHAGLLLLLKLVRMLACCYCYCSCFSYSCFCCFCFHCLCSNRLLLLLLLMLILLPLVVAQAGLLGCQL